MARFLLPGVATPGARSPLGRNCCSHRGCGGVSDDVERLSPSGGSAQDERSLQRCKQTYDEPSGVVRGNTAGHQLFGASRDPVVEDVRAGLPEHLAMTRHLEGNSGDGAGIGIVGGDQVIGRACEEHAHQGQSVADANGHDPTVFLGGSWHETWPVAATGAAQVGRQYTRCGELNPT